MRKINSEINLRTCMGKHRCERWHGKRRVGGAGQTAEGQETVADSFLLMHNSSPKSGK